MKSRWHWSFIALGVVALVATTYRFAIAADAKTPGPTNDITRFVDQTCLVVFDLGADGVERTVLKSPKVTDIGGKHFLGGVVTSEHKDFRVINPGTTAYVPLNRIAYIQILGDPQD